MTWREGYRVVGAVWSVPDSTPKRELELDQIPFEVEVAWRILVAHK